MMKYILFILLTNGNISAVEFNEEQACELAVVSVSVRSTAAKIAGKTVSYAVADAWCLHSGREQ